MKMARGQKASKLGSQAAASRHINAIHIAAFVPNNTYVCVCYNKSVSIFSTFFRSCKQTHIHFYITPYSDLRWKENKESSKRNDCILSLRAIIKAIFIIDTHKRTHLHTSTSENMCKVTPTRKNWLKLTSLQCAHNWRVTPKTKNTLGNIGKIELVAQNETFLHKHFVIRLLDLWFCFQQVGQIRT